MSKLSTLVTTTFTPIAICVALTFTSSALAHKGKDRNHQEMRQMLSELDLSSAQKQDIRQLMKQNREDSGLYKDDAKPLNQSLQALVQSDQWQQTEVENILAEQQVFLAEKALQNATNKHQVWSVLTVEQQAQLAEKITEFKANRKDQKINKRKVDRRFKHLDLSEEQVAAISSLKAAVETDIQLTKAKINNFKQAELQLIQSPNFSADSWQSLWQQYQGDFTTAKVLKIKVQHETWKVLSPEQQTNTQTKGKQAKHVK